MSGTFPPETMRALADAVEVNDVVDLRAELPDVSDPGGPADRFAAGFRLSHQLWQERFDPAALLRVAARLRHVERLDQAARRELKQVRAAFKHLRFAFFLYDARHRAPPFLSLVTLELGELQDAARVGRADRVRRHTAALRWLLAAPARPLLRWEVARFRPTAPAEFARFTRDQLASLRPLLAAPTAHAHAFHAARKVVSRQVSFHDDMRTLYPAAPAADHHRAAARWLASLNGLMGQFHDELVSHAATGAFDYRREAFALPGAIRERLELLVARSPGTSSS